MSAESLHSYSTPPRPHTFSSSPCLHTRLVSSPTYHCICEVPRCTNGRKSPLSDHSACKSYSLSEKYQSYTWRKYIYNFIRRRLKFLTLKVKRGKSTSHFESVGILPFLLTWHGYSRPERPLGLGKTAFF